MSNNRRSRLYFLPIILSLWFPLTFIITYVMAVEAKDVPAIFPYISDTGTFSPESCIFGQLLNMGSLLMASIVYLRYRQVEEWSNTYSVKENFSTINKRSLRLGLIASLGVSIVANFQETNILIVHILGAFLAFGLGQFYFILNTVIHQRLLPYNGTVTMRNLRVFLATINTIACTISGLTGIKAFISFTGTDITKWSKEDGAFTSRLTSTITEWITAVAVVLYILTFTDEFKSLNMERPSITITNNDGKQQMRGNNSNKVNGTPLEVAVVSSHI